MLHKQCDQILELKIAQVVQKVAKEVFLKES